MTSFFMDPECSFEFAKVPSDIPKRFRQPLYDVLWAYWLEQCAGRDARLERKAAHDAIAKQKGWVSQYDMKEAGFTEFGDPMVPEEVVQAELKRIINQECPC